MNAEPIVDSSWLIATTKHYADAFFVAQHFQEARSLEISALGQQGFVILDFDKLPDEQDQKNFQKLFGEKIHKHNFLGNVPADVIKSFLSLDNSKVKDGGLLFFEFDYIEDAFVVACKAQELKFGFVDFRFLRGTAVTVHLILTADSSKDLQDFNNNTQCKYSQIMENPSQDIRRYFEIYPV